MTNSLFFDTPLPSPITEFAVQVTSNLEGEDNYASGTAVIVAEHLAFAARHVLDEHWRLHERRSMPVSASGDVAGRFSLVLGQMVGDSLNLWTVTRLWSADFTDIVVLRLTPYSAGAKEYKFRRLTLDLLPPTVGENISAFGFHENKTTRDDKNIQVRLRSATTHGQVIEVHDLKRDSARLPFPCFRTNARFEGGMSGGPVFNSSGDLCGLICSNLPPSAPDEDHVSYVVSLWPAMGIPIDINRVGHPAGIRYPLFDLIADKILVAKNADRIVMDHVHENGIKQIGLRVT